MVAAIQARAGEYGVGAKRIAEATGVGYDAVLAAFAEGELRGRNVGGRTGWRTTWDEVSHWLSGREAPSMETRVKWLADRRRGIGGSDIAALAGVHPYKTALDVWLDKQGGSAMGDVETARMRLGTMLEEPVIKLYERERGVRVQRPGLVHGRAPHELGTPDGVVVNGGPVLEIKTCDAFSRDKWGEPGVDGAVRADALCQVQWYLYLLARETAHVVVFDVDRAETRTYVVEREQRAIDAMRTVAAHFWETHVHGGVPPLPSNDDSDEAWSRISSALGLAFKGGKGSLVGGAELGELVVDYDKARAEAKRWKETQDAAGARIKATLGDHESASVTGHPEVSITWKPIKGRIDVARFADDAWSALEDSIGKERAAALRTKSIAAHTGEPTRTLNVRINTKGKQ